MQKRKRRFSPLAFRLLAAVFATVLVLQAASTLTVYSLIERDLKQKRASDMDEILDSVIYTISSDKLNGPDGSDSTNPNSRSLRVLIEASQAAYTDVYPTYADSHLDEGDITHEAWDSYLEEFKAAYNTHAGMGMSAYGDPPTFLRNLLSTIVTPSSSLFAYVGFIDPTTQNFVLAVGAYDFHDFPTPEKEAVASLVMSRGYFFDWSYYAGLVEGEEPEEQGFIGRERKIKGKGALSVSARRFAFQVDGTPDYSKDYWLFLETGMDYFSSSTERYSLTFLYTSLASFALLFIGLGVMIYFLSIRRIRRLEEMTGEAVGRLKQGKFERHFTPSSRKHPDEINALNDGIAFFEGELLSYVAQREAAIKEEEKNRAEMAFSAQIQRATLPEEPIDDGEVAIYPALQLAKDVGGDLYDYFQIDENRYLFLIGDVSGKGVPAALFMMQAFAKIKAKLGGAGEFHLGEEIASINDDLAKHNPMSLFVTMFIGVADAKEGTLSYVNCGHEEAFFYHDGEYQMLHGASNLPLGAAEGLEFEMGTLKLSKGDRLFLYTDGVSEAESKQGEFYGKERIGKALNSLSILPDEALVSALLEEVGRFQEGKEQSDDICMVSFSYRPEAYVRLPNDLPSIDAAQDFITRNTKGIEDEEAVANLRLALDELLSNVISYAYQGEKGVYYLRLHVDKRKKRIEGALIDKGIPFNPLKKAPNEDIDNVPGGLGILVAKNALEDIDYARIGPYNVLRFEKAYKK